MSAFAFHKRAVEAVQFIILKTVTDFLGDESGYRCSDGTKAISFSMVHQCRRCMVKTISEKKNGCKSQVEPDSHEAASPSRSNVLFSSHDSGHAKAARQRILFLSILPERSSLHDPPTLKYGPHTMHQFLLPHAAKRFIELMPVFETYPFRRFARHLSYVLTVTDQRTSCRTGRLPVGSWMCDRGSVGAGVGQLLTHLVLNKLDEADKNHLGKSFFHAI